MSTHFRKTTTTLLPPPFVTNCYDYSLNAIYDKSPRSQQDCMFEYIKEKERKVCGYNSFWNQKPFNWNSNAVDIQFITTDDCYSRPNSCTQE